MAGKTFSFEELKKLPGWEDLPANSQAILTEFNKQNPQYLFSFQNGEIVAGNPAGNQNANEVLETLGKGQKVYNSYKQISNSPIMTSPSAANATVSNAPLTDAELAKLSNEAYSGTSAAGEGAGSTTSALGKLATALAVGNALYSGYKGATDTESLGYEERGGRAVQGAGRAVGAYFSGGISEGLIAATDAIFRKGTSQKLMDKSMKNVTKYGDYFMPGLGTSLKLATKGAAKLLGDRTKHTELRNLRRAMEDGIISEEEFAARAENAKKMGEGGRKGIDPNKNYNERLQSELKAGKTQAEAEAEASWFKQYSDYVKSGKDKEADSMLRGKDITGYANVMEAVSKGTGKNYLKELTGEQRDASAQAILDYDKIKDDTYFSARGAPSLNVDTKLSEILKRIGSGEKYDQTWIGQPVPNITPPVQISKPQDVPVTKPSSNQELIKLFGSEIKNPSQQTTTQNLQTPPVSDPNALIAQLLAGQQKAVPKVSAPEYNALDVYNRLRQTSQYAPNFNK